jgi:GDPmannose 4,6-dehydratase
MWLMLQQAEPDDYVIATGETHSVREFVERAFAHVGTAIEWRGTGLDECGFRAGTDEKVVCVDPHYFRPSEIDVLLGDPTRAKKKLGWTPTISFPELIKDMVASDIKALA